MSEKQPPLVHNITNYVTVNDVANILLACGARPESLSDEPEDVEDITSICGGLNINIGTLHRTSIDGMYRAGAKAASLGHKILLESSRRRRKPLTYFDRSRTDGKKSRSPSSAEIFPKSKHWHLEAERQRVLTQTLPIK